MDKFYSFIFRGLLSEEALDRAGRQKRSQFGVEMETQISDRLGINILDNDLVAKSKKMAIVYIAISAFENSIRSFVSKILLEMEGEDWWNKCVPDKIRANAEIKQKEELKTRYQTSRGDDPIMFVDFGDLVSIIQKDGNWKYFEVYLGKIEWARGIMDILEKSRNVIMHSGELGDKDIERVGMNIRDWITQVGS